MRRREFITLLGGAGVTWPLSARAQQTKSPARIGMLPIGLPSNTYDKSLVESFRQGLRDVGDAGPLVVEYHPQAGPLVILDHFEQRTAPASIFERIAG